MRGSRGVWLALGACAFLLLLTATALRRRIPYNVAPELKPLLRSTMGVSRGLEGRVKSSGGTTHEDWLALRNYVLATPCSEFIRSAKQSLKPEDGWRIVTLPSGPFAMAKLDKHGLAALELQAEPANEWTEVRIKVLDPPIGPLSVFIWRVFGIVSPLD